MSKKVSLTQEIEKELNGDQEPPKRSKIHEYFLNKLTPEELAEHQRKVAEKRRATWAAKKEQQEQIKQQAMALVPSVLAHDIAQKELESENFIPTQDMIDKMKLLLKKDITIEELRKRYFRTVSDNTWHKIIKYVFKSQVMQIEDVGADILSAKRNAIELLRKRIKEYKKEIKAYKQTDGNHTRLS
jgi:hypothetical protein